jgi:hypothetical protein
VSLPYDHRAEVANRNPGKIREMPLIGQTYCCRFLFNGALSDSAIDRIVARTDLMSTPRENPHPLKLDRATKMTYSKSRRAMDSK